MATKKTAPKGKAKKSQNKPKPYEVDANDVTLGDWARLMSQWAAQVQEWIENPKRPVPDPPPPPPFE